MNVKVCGIATVEQLTELESAGADFAGLIFVASSPRNALALKDQAPAIRKLSIRKVGVFVNEDLQTVLKTAEDFGLDMVQLHGDEDAEYCSGVNTIIPVIKVFRISGETPLQQVLESFQNVSSYFLFDTRGKDSYGGTGKTFDWTLLNTLIIRKPFFLSGGISPENLSDITALNEERKIFGVDINSRFEISPGIKDMKAVASFITKLKAINQ